MSARHNLRWLAVPVAIVVSCLAGMWLYMETAFGIGLGAGLQCLSEGKEAGTCMTPAERAQYWSWAVASSVLSGLASVFLAVTAAPRYRQKVRLAATLIPPVGWLWFSGWNVNDYATWVLVAGALAGGFLAWLVRSADP